MSDSELSTPANIPADADIEQCLRRIVRDALKADEEITTKSARARAERDLGLDTGFLKDNPQWKKRSKDVIGAAVDEPQSPEKPKKSAPKPKAKPAAKAGTKRKSDEAQPRKKRQKKAPTPVSDEDVVEDDGEEVEAPKTEAKKAFERPQYAVDDSEEEPEEVKVDAEPAPRAKSEDESALSEPPDDAEAEAPKVNAKPVEDDESDMSVVLDDPPAKKKRQRKSTSTSEAKGKSEKSAKPAKAPKELSPDEEEIKRLQGWLVKCGIRKVWGVELKKYETSKEKMKHLKSMLSDVGMTGRYSVEKADQIKEARELAADIEAAKEFNEQWGQKGSGSGDEEEGGGSADEAKSKEDAKPRRLRPKGLIDFGDSGDDE
ncbi:hypothetical protein LTR36_009283 [Oleoguttula mirabilis]|uniref:Transcriptional regulator n=1 Tax=Oleoguttula mirabilis TaxID=1507867 RepID=A0AAV9J6K1_9PEZI|nr:hypothetical protein LTR36_009283 [Oleoguttula mirabilis]